MTEKPTTFRDVIKLWGRIRRFAERLDQPYKRVSKWYERGYIDVLHWDPVIEAVRADHGIELTHADLHAMTVAHRQSREAA
jgi:hypothetical protein